MYLGYCMKFRLFMTVIILPLTGCMQFAQTDMLGPQSRKFTSRPAEIAPPNPAQKPPTSPRPTVTSPSGRGPLVIEDKNNVVYENITVSNTNGECITINDSKNITIINSNIGPCKGGNGILVVGGSSIRIHNSYIHDASDEGVKAQGVNGLTVTSNHIERVSTGVYALNSFQVQVERNQFLNVQGPRPRGGGAQFDKVSGTGNRINCNTIINNPGESSTEDVINLFMSNGTMGDPIQIKGNKLIGGGPSTSGGGIMLGDNGGSNMIAQHNILVDPGQYGIAVAAGVNIKVLNNTIFGRRQAFTNVGLYIWNQYKVPCGNNIVDGNKVNFTHSKGGQNSYFMGDDSPAYSGYECKNDTWGRQNTWSAPITAAIADQNIDFCK